MCIQAYSREIRSRITESHYSRFPVAQRNLDNVLGIAAAKDLLNRCLVGEPLDLHSPVSQPLFVPDSQSALQLLQLFKKAHTHLALVVDEYGQLEGLVTMHDVLESIVGDMHAVGDADLYAVERGNGSWLLDGSLLIDEFKEIFPVATRADEDRSYETIAGLVITQPGRLPRTADSFEWQGLRFEVVDMDGLCVDKVLVTPVPTEVAPSPNNFSDG